MRFGKLVLLGVFLFASAANAQDVMVDLSVLDDLETPHKIVSKPLFPVLPKKAEVKVKKATKQKVAIKPVKKHKPKKIVEKVKPLDDDIVVVDFEPVSKPAVAPVAEAPKPVVEESKPAVAPVAEAPKPVVEETKPAVAPVVETPKPAVEESKPAVAPVVETPKPAEDPKTDLLVSDKKEPTKEDSYIRFASDADELNNEQKAKIDSIVAGYKNTPKNKIAIYSYNFDDGVDSFKKKRTSLNRAVEIRSYLLKKGYKNFSIKVINITNASDKKNIVELQEI